MQTNLHVANPHARILNLEACTPNCIIRKPQRPETVSCGNFILQDLHDSLAKGMHLFRAASCVFAPHIRARSEHTPTIGTNTKLICSPLTRCSPSSYNTVLLKHARCNSCQLAHIPAYTRAYQRIPARARAYSGTLAHTRAYQCISRVLAHTRAHSRILAHTRAYSRIPAHTRAYSRILAHTRAYPRMPAHTRAYQRIPARTRAYSDTLAHTRAYSRILAHTRAYPRIPAHTRAYPRIPAHTRAYPRILAHTCAYPALPKPHARSRAFPPQWSFQRARKKPRVNSQGLLSFSADDLYSHAKACQNTCLAIPTPRLGSS